MSRPYFKKSIAELEAVYQDNREDDAVCKLLLHELSHRSTQRAQTLTAAINAAGKDDIPGEVVPPTLLQPQVSAKDDFSEVAMDATNTFSTTQIDLGPKPEVTDDPVNILRAWTALEVLSPQGYRRETDLVSGQKSLIARFDESDLPWTLGEKSRPKKRLYYELILGAVALEPAVEKLLKLYADNRPDKPAMRGHCPLATILLHKDGCPLEEENSAAISSFAWGVPVALQGDLKKLAAWPSQEKALIASLRKKLIRRDKEGEILPLTKAHIGELFDHLVDALSLHDHDINAPYFALRRYEFFASKTPPEPSLLNSFYLEDLSLARTHAQNGTLPNVLRHYLAIEKPAHKTDLLQDDAGLQHILQPGLTPLGRWPGNGRFPLALLQQAAVNATNPSMMETGILAVNGPPGTGKTTLLRDVVAARIIERAIVMSGYKRPADAFSSTSHILQRSGAKITLHELGEKLKGFEMVVASSNNKAVENVSAELPALDAVADDAPNLRYFKSISDNLLSRETWGAVAAVLGNSGNRYNFSQNFWRDDEKGLSTYLNHASGIPQIVSEKADDGSVVKRNREIVDLENPPANAREANARWEKAREAFFEAQGRAQDSQDQLQSLHAKLIRLVVIEEEIEEIVASQPDLKSKLEQLKSDFSNADRGQAEAEAALSKARDQRDRFHSTRPSFFARLFQTQGFKSWQSEFDRLKSKVKDAVGAQGRCKARCHTLRAELDVNQNALRQSDQKIDALKSEQANCKARLSEALPKLKAPAPDVEFFAEPHEKIQVSNVWFDQAASKLRDDLFEAAILLHRAFIDAAADPLRQNLSVFVESFGTRSLGTPQKDMLIADLWASFFLVVPVVSTTFASVHRMFSRLGPDALGWLLVDEAGQAAPQQAIGAMLRTKRSVVVGDPLQIEPVVTLPTSLTEEICGYFGIDALKFNAPEASVQTVADAASLYCARFPIGSGRRDVGAPLLVHRRCDSPMFDISNEIAYSNLMVQAKKPSPENPILGPSAWIDIQGKAGPDKYCADEATVLIDMLRKLRSGGADPDLYVVTPFVVVQDNLRREILASGVLDGWVVKPNSWVWEHVGTVHTVQGREAGIVFFVLGAQLPSQNGARVWAGGRPNLVNVAVTRAKASFYVIGNRQLWKSAGVFSVLDRYL